MKDEWKAKPCGRHLGPVLLKNDSYTHCAGILIR
ncbi:hypothetical protein SAMN05192552_104317 [Natrinema hispanicum]|uniref:Uncharacterized protein n=1 Tax=Natrinema hispanicum TaxID=392421 RepID=A0A1G6X7D9_9EURY|nr:hypothetical protein SAMN05192552_104317 [Natrinema hispanicum]SET34259.1 hypothetical protein SAMN04488694_105246 [Natrinema hispanicum]